MHARFELPGPPSDRRFITPSSVADLREYCYPPTPSRSAIRALSAWPGRARCVRALSNVAADPVGGGPVGRAHNNYGGKHAKAGVEQRVLGVQVAADDIGQLTACAVGDYRHLPPGR